MSIPGTPRLVPVMGGELPQGSPDPVALFLETGVNRIGDVELLVEPDGRVTLRGEAVIDGRPVMEAVLVHGNRIALPTGDLVFQAELEHDDGGRQGGEEPFTRGLADVDDPDRYNTAR